MPRRTNLLLACVASFALSSARVQADTLLHQEPPDLSTYHGTPTDLGTFSDGVNVIRGSAGNGADWWYADLDAGRFITSILFSASGLPPTYYAQLDLRDVDLPQNFTTLTTRFYLQSGNGSDLPVPALVGTYPLTGPALVKGNVFVSLFNSDYEIRITVGSAAVATPEPATIGFLAMAGGVLLRSLRRRAVRK